MSQQQVLAERSQEANVQCIHHWVIESPSGPLSRGVCKRCRKVRDFRNYVEGGFWEDDVNVQRGSRRGWYSSGEQWEPQTASTEEP